MSTPVLPYPLSMSTKTSVPGTSADQDDASWRGLLNQLDHERRSGIRTYTAYIRRDDARFSPPSSSCDSV
jgi:hypothetical protein